MYGVSMYMRMNLHVLDSDVKVIRAARKKLVKRDRRNPKLRDARKALYREMIQHHREARALFKHFRF